MTESLPAPAVDDPAARRWNLAIWLGLFTGPVSFLLGLAQSYALLAVRCRQITLPALLWMKLVPVLLTLSASWPAWHVFRHRAREGEGTSRERNTFLGVAALLSVALFVVVGLASALPVLFLGPCDR